MSYVVLARKWRPMSFDDLVGQDHVARTLANAIAAGRVAHAFLFTGVRGVGKTTSARILAKALNCMRQPGTVGNGVDPGPTAEPCLECAACREIAEGLDMDVREIDGASYNGVDEVRRLQDSLPYRPSRDRYKIFIVDEVHMLSQAAWNAFLKTLEEPPPHVKFIFATTEVHKVPVTILSRVQRFDFKLISASQIAARLRHVLAEEKVATDDTAISIIAREAAGSMRDAMSLLDQVIPWSKQGLTGENVAQVLGVASRQVLHDLVARLLKGDAEACLRIVSDLANQGYDMGHVARDLLNLLRDCVVARVCSEPRELLDLPQEEALDVIKLASEHSPDDLLRLHQGFSRSYDDVLRSGQPRAGLEMVLVRLARRPPLLPIDDLIARLAKLEQRLQRGPTSAPAAPSAPPRSGGGSRPGRAMSAPKATPASTAARATSASSPASRPEPPVLLEAAGAAPAQAIPAPAPLATSARSEGTALEQWTRILSCVENDNPALAAMLKHVAPDTVGTDRLVLHLERGSVFEATVTGSEALASLERAAEQVLGSRPKVLFQAPTNGRSLKTLAALNQEKRAHDNREAELRARNHPQVQDAVSILGARIKEIQLSED